MADYMTNCIRNIALMGHGGEGKTTLTEAMLYAAKIIDRQGKVEDGTTTTDFEPEEIRRKCSISAALAPIDWNDKMLNIVDVPGYFDFVGETVGPLRVVETACIVVSAASGLTVGAEKAFTRAVKSGVGRMYVINQMDRENVSFSNTLQQLRERHGSCVVPVLIPIGEGPDFRGVVNVLDGKAYEGAYEKSVEVPMPENMKERVARALDAITEQVASDDEVLMEKYFSGEEITPEELLNGFHKGMKDGSIVPVCACSALTGVGIARMMDLMAKYLPSPKHQGIVHEGFNPRNGEAVTRTCVDEEPFSAYIFKTIADPFVGKLSLFRIFSGTLTSDTTLYNVNKDKTEKMSGIYILRGKKQVAKKLLHAGDMGALNKLQFSATGDTLCDYNHPIQYSQLAFPAPCFSKAVYAAKQGEEDKVFGGLSRLAEEDPSIVISKDPDTTETLLSGQGEMHLDVIRNKLAAKFNANALLQDPKIAYRESIRRPIDVEGRHKKQTGGHGQFGDVKIKFRPNDDPNDTEFHFEDAVVGGTVPRNFIPAVEKGLRENIKHGVLAGYPVVGLTAQLYDGGYHPVDSSEMAFKTAARLAFKQLTGAM
ncbi:MAG: elongation factor G, partial [Clostridia bacterium]|nr:elongation factor G [Clostridia bacterium]